MYNNQFFIAKLVGSEEVPPVRTNADGIAEFKVTNRAIRYQLRVNNLANFTQAHIHLGRRGVNGPVVAFLFGPADPAISVKKGVIEGTITAGDLVGPLTGRPLSTLIDLMRKGKTYVNAHTVQNPDGEIRGQIKPFKR
ncbi:CHRD domain-containing protein [Virgibacillus byunsanensis]|uniref:CHRD domain-containing protein n=1 Tax=Virgibacillus byunsanensis TaxID=570945 RepID=A0ABW3LQ25_9BACI